MQAFYESKHKMQAFDEFMDREKIIKKENVNVRLPEGLHLRVKQAAPARCGTLEKAYEEALTTWLDERPTRAVARSSTTQVWVDELRMIATRLERIAQNVVDTVEAQARDDASNADREAKEAGKILAGERTTEAGATSVQGHQGRPGRRHKGGSGN